MLKTYRKEMYLFSQLKVKVKQSRYSPEVAQNVPES